MAIVTPQDWDHFVEQKPEAHLLQSPQWGELKSRFGWRPVHFIVNNCGAQVLIRDLTPIFSIAYIPKGPVGTEWALLWPEIDLFCRRHRTVFLKVEPDVIDSDWEHYGHFLTGFRRSNMTVQPRRTISINLRGTEQEWLSRMKQKTRYNIQLARKKEVIVKPSSNVEEFYALLLETGTRDGFGVHVKYYYQSAFDIFLKNEQCVLLIAYLENTPLAGVMVFSRGKRAWYLFGASSDRERNRMPSYLLQYEAMKWAYVKGCIEYDLWGVPDVNEDELEAVFDKRNDGLWGVYRFKRGFGGNVLRSAGAYDKVYLPTVYWFFRLMNKVRNQLV